MFTVLLAQYYRNWFNEELKKETCLEELDSMESYDEVDADSKLKSPFLSASSFLPTIVGKLDRSTLIEFYALYKQATCGPAKPSDRPSFFDAKGKLKYDAWLKLGEMSKEAAMEEYVAKMVRMNLGWNPSRQMSSQCFGIRPSRPAAIDEPSEGDFESAGERELLLWFTAAKADDETTIMEIFSRRPELLNCTDRHLGMTALHWAIDSGCDKVINFLISNGVDVNVVDPEGNTPLHFAAYCCRQAAAEILIAKGADRSVRNSDGQTAADACDDPTLRLILTPPST